MGGGLGSNIGYNEDFCFCSVLTGMNGRNVGIGGSSGLRGKGGLGGGGGGTRRPGLKRVKRKL